MVDDNQELRATLAEVLTQKGLFVQAAGNADQALVMLERSPVNLLLLERINKDPVAISGWAFVYKKMFSRNQCRSR